jgi:hypothetical protein
MCFVRRNRGTGQDEVTRCASLVIDGSSDLIPKSWVYLPFVDEPRSLPPQEEFWLKLRESAGIVIDVEPNRACGVF